MPWSPSLGIFFIYLSNRISIQFWILTSYFLYVNNFIYHQNAQDSALVKNCIMFIVTKAFIVSSLLMSYKREEVYSITFFYYGGTTRLMFLRQDYPGKTHPSASLVLVSGFSFSCSCCHNNIKEPSLLKYFLIVGERIVQFIPFQGVLAWCEMKTASCWIWTQVTEST